MLLLNCLQSHSKYGVTNNNLRTNDGFVIPGIQCKALYIKST